MENGATTGGFARTLSAGTHRGETVVLTPSVSQALDTSAYSGCQTSGFSGNFPDAPCLGVALWRPEHGDQNGQYGL